MSMDIKFRNFVKTDYEDYLRLFSQYSIDLKKVSDEDYREIIKNRGFMMGKPPELESLLKALFSQCAMIDNKVIGFIRGNRIEKDRDRDTSLFQDGKLVWLDNNHLRSDFEHQIGLEVGGIMVDNNYLRKGIGSQLFNNLSDYLERTKISNLFSWVVNKPQNKASLNFHKKKGFVHIASFNAKVAFGIPDYQSYLLYKGF